jgi:hypothetical protein
MKVDIMEEFGEEKEEVIWMKRRKTNEPRK